MTATPQTFQEPIIRPAGDLAMLVEWGEGISLQTHHRVMGLVRELEKLDRGVLREWIPSYTSVLVLYDPLQCSSDEVMELLQRMVSRSSPLAEEESRRLEIPVIYGGSYGPDLDEVARLGQMTPDEVIRRHSSAEYRVYLLGFSPGFPFLGGLDPSLATPRLETPRLKVPAGSVGIGGWQTGIYPVESPGGWRLIGWTPEKIFDPKRQPPFLLNVGDRVRFVKAKR